MSGTHTFVGGMRTPSGSNATWPLARLTIDHATGVEVRVRVVHLLPPRRYAWSELALAENIRGRLLGSAGVRLIGKTSPVVIFWTSNPRTVLYALAEHGASTVWHERPPGVVIRP